MSVAARVAAACCSALLALGTACSSEPGDAAAEQPLPDAGQNEDAGAEPEPLPDPEPDDCITEVDPGLHVLSCGGKSFTVNVPEACLEAACGLIVDVHGGSMSAEMQNNNTNLRALGAKQGFLVIQPQAGTPPLSLWSTADDAVVLDFIERAVQAWHLDAKRLHFTGFSQGGSMTWRFLCKHGERFASLAPAAESPNCGGFPSIDEDCFQMPDRVPATRRSLLYMHGTKDGIQPFPCAEETRDNVVSGWKLGGQEEIAAGTGFARTRWTAGELVFELLQHDYVAGPTPLAQQVLGAELDGHCYPGSDDPGGLPGQYFKFKCEGDNAFTWGEEVVDFFAAHPLP